WNKVLTIILALAIVGAIGASVYILVNPNKGEKYTEFYILSLSGKADDYPQELAIGEEGGVLVGIANRERTDTVYRVAITIDGIVVEEINEIALEDNEQWEEPVSFTSDTAGANQKVEFLLYNGLESDPYLILNLYIDVT
ncbi:DUF1616 domain-containing protein, partial [Chloroflexota bacterium]